MVTNSSIQVGRFNPSVGILFCRTRHRETLASIAEVSIPRSGFCFVELTDTQRLKRAKQSFQSLGRDSVLSNKTTTAINLAHGLFQSLGRDSVLSNPALRSSKNAKTAVSIPRSGFCFVEHYPPVTIPGGGTSFNPSVGILFCRTSTRAARYRLH